MSDKKQVPHSGPTNIKRHGTKYTRPDKLGPGICASLYPHDDGIGNKELQRMTVVAVTFFS